MNKKKEKKKKESNKPIITMGENKRKRKDNKSQLARELKKPLRLEKRKRKKEKKENKINSKSVEIPRSPRQEVAAVYA